MKIATLSWIEKKEIPIEGECFAWRIRSLRGLPWKWRLPWLGIFVAWGFILFLKYKALGFFKNKALGFQARTGNPRLIVPNGWIYTNVAVVVLIVDVVKLKRLKVVSFLCSSFHNTLLFWLVSLANHLRPPFGDVRRHPYFWKDIANIQFSAEKSKRFYGFTYYFKLILIKM